MNTENDRVVEPRTETGRWLVEHQGLVNIGKIDGSMRGDEIDLRQAVVTIEIEAATLDAATEPSHPHDGYAYDGCNCVCCTNVRALAASGFVSRELE